MPVLSAGKKWPRAVEPEVRGTVSTSSRPGSRCSDHQDLTLIKTMICRDRRRRGTAIYFDSLSMTASTSFSHPTQKTPQVIDPAQKGTAGRASAPAISGRSLPERRAWPDGPRAMLYGRGGQEAQGKPSPT